MAYQDLTRRIEEIKARIQKVFPYEVATIIHSQDNQVLILDVREDSEYEMEYLETAVNLPYPQIEEKIEEIISDKSARIISYCQSGNRSALATDTLNQLGYENAVSLVGGIVAWKAEGRAIIEKDLSQNAYISSIRYQNF